jgi:thiamine pyrophosphokinase
MGAEKGLIFGSAPCDSWDFLEPYRTWPDVVIGADGGIHAARAAGFSPEVYVGDSDSGGAPEGTRISVPLKPEKDFTDLEAAYHWARDQGIRQVIFTGCTGGRLDHQLAALSLLEQAAEEGIQAMLLDGRNRVEFLQPGTHKIQDLGYRYFSILPADRVLTGVSISGAKYGLQNATVFRRQSLTVSNEFAAPWVEITLESGCGYLIYAK